MCDWFVCYRLYIFDYFMCKVWGGLCFDDYNVVIVNDNVGIWVVFGGKGIKFFVDLGKVDLFFGYVFLGCKSFGYLFFFCLVG